MNRFLLLFLLLFSFSASGQTANALSWYKVLTGTIDKYPVTMHLHKKDHLYTGYYYYHSRHQPVSFRGSDTVKGKAIVLQGFTGEEDTESFTFTLAGGKGSGTWKKNEKARELRFSVAEKAGDSVLAFDYVFTKGTAVLRPKLKESPEGTFEAASVWPKGSGERDEFLKRIIREAFGGKETAGTIGNLLLQQKKAFLSGYIEDHKDAAPDEIKETSFAYNADETVSLEVLYETPALLVLAHTFYTYSGGAHGMYGSSYHSLDLKRLKKIKLSDLLDARGLKAVNTLLPNYFRKKFNLKDSEPLTEGGLFENKIEANENFYLTTKGITFVYQPYEIGPYAMGEIEVFLPFTELSAHIQPEYKHLVL